MARRSKQKPDRHRLLHQHHDAKDNHLDGDVKEDTEKMSVLEKLMLSASLWGSEACSDFEHLYTVPTLQTLGMPLHLVSITGLVAGPCATLLLPSLGWLTDQGSNPQRRKIIATIFAAGLLFSGMVCIIVANMLHLDFLLELSNNRLDNVSDSSNTSMTWGQIYPNTSNGQEGDGASLVQEMATMEDAVSRPGSNAMDQFKNGSPSSGMTEESEGSEIPFKAGLGLLGFILLDMGCDTTFSCVKSFVLMCGPRSEHTSLLVIGIITASAGGVSTAALGVVDLPSVLDLPHIDGARLTMQSTIQAIVIIGFVVLGLLVSLLTAHRRLKIRSSRSEDPSCISRSTDPRSSPSYDANMHHEEHFSRSVVLDALENSTRSFGGGAIHFDQTLALLEEHQHTQSFDSQSHQSVPGEHIPLLSEEVEKREEEQLESSQLTSLSLSYRNRDGLFPISEHALPDKSCVKDLPEDDVDMALAHASHCERSFKVKLLLIAVSTYFTVSVIFLFTLTSSDFVGKAIYGGDPHAPPGSESMVRYQDGVRMASWGFFTYYISFLLISSVHPQLLALIGYRVEFAAAHLMMGAALVALILVENLEMYFVLTVVAAFQRACFFVIPFAVTNDLIQSRAKERGDGKKNVGLAISMVTASMPLSYCTLYPWIGPLEELTGLVTIPYWMASASAVMATCIFLAIGKV